ncbi:lon protease homolog 4, chloroplastic/mitochondrial isoform X1 [Arabidopsis lyrata subsp. lyrata]|uniref:lon protease homolog 4, chloroplastic/mitochondrial isoform X1 n=1 Tax=Arabidopsis lyrata subsp. lyrata TaxID=81972 RepID=UPI000A29C8D6|nr:lon protease homolog 4, chloroplastic/mitochondrial isoform X1 [Arabidopsis lyrata subsp. lyrata]|eukprot:XP_020887889.1 lon protease homolog 4, chloroplastic/mitochondrial isoform X1 [Arabidopsis lyrata subsp. lyrata]
MLKLLTPTASHHVTPAIRFRSTPVKSLLFKQLTLLTGWNRTSYELGRRAFSSELDSDAKSSATTTVSTKPHLDDCLTVIALPLPHKPLIPGFYMPIYVKDPKVLAALQESRRQQALYAGAFLFKDDASTDSSSSSETENILEKLKGKELLNRIHEVGTLAKISSIQGEQVILIGRRRLRITEMVSEDPLTVKVDHLKDKPYDKDDDVIKATYFQVMSTLRDVLKTTSLWRDQVRTYTQHIGEFNYPRLADFGAGISGANKHQNQGVLEELDVHKRLELTLELVKKEVEINKIQESIAKAVEEKFSGDRRRIILKEQINAIKKELGVETDNKSALSEKFRGRVDPIKDKIPEHVLKVIEEELKKLQLLETSSSEYDVTYNYLDWLTVLPWGKFSDENFDVLRAEKILDEDHYGLSDVKERILEFIAVGRLRGTSQGKIICLSGPPGVGKTSIGRSIARALDRKFFRFSVGGLSDVAEIKGHRRTYIGAMPGKMVQCLKNVGTENPLVLIDEIDKLGVRCHDGDPASAMLELLDPEQNANFLDHYLNVTIDLSKVLFVCTANVTDTIPSPLLDRMEVITLSGYITDEKMHIARDYLVKTARRDCGIKPEQVDVSDAALLSLIENYCREAGVRNLQKQIEKVFRKIALKLVRKGAASAEVPAISDDVTTDNGDTKSLAKTDLESPETSADGSTVLTDELATGDTKESKTEQSGEVDETVEKLMIDESNLSEGSTVLTDDLATGDLTESTTEQSGEVAEKFMIDESNLSDYIGKPVFQAEKIYKQTPVGVVMGLAWTSMGGSTLYIETTFVEEGEGKGGLHITGRLGDVMKESAEIAHTVARRIMLEKKPENKFFANSKLHLHVPAGATPKDGPSAGCTMITSLLSLASKKPVRKDLAMTGEVTLTGRILAIGGVKEKTIAAKRSQVKVIIFPEANRRDFDELAENVKEGLEVHFVNEYEQIFELAFGYDH